MLVFRWGYPKKQPPGKQVADNFHQLETSKTSHSCLKKMVLSYDFPGSIGGVLPAACQGTGIDNSSKVKTLVGKDDGPETIPTLEELYDQKKCLNVI